MDEEWVNSHEATHIAKYGILLPPNVLVPKGFNISLGVVPMTPRKEFSYKIFRRRHKEVLWLDPQYDADSAY